ncbi:MAG: hypothetical protein IJ771_07330 [Clostridia bacterium]|nr:hypothetical protein [Clostridia bacterium]MBR1827506.1 hypothetical protein [Clostridia bacterium]MEE1293197.1 GDSL-type esterase/lipase family protein [Acutalibacteraceae bacterium]
MKHWKRAVCLLTTWLLLISMCVLPSVAKTPSSKAASGRNYRTVTVIGDSLATGYMIQNRDGSYVEHTHGKRIRAAWPSRVADSVNATVYNNYAREGSGTNEILRLLDPDYEPDTYFKEVSDRVIEKYFDGEAAFAMYQKKVRTDIEQSDLILLNCGSNDLFATVNTVFRKLMNNELDSVKAQAKRKVLLQLKDTVDALVAEGQFAKAWATIYQVLSTINMADDAVEALLECATRGYLNFQKNWGRIAKTIHDINPDAQVVVISLFNGTQGLGALPGTNISIGNALDPIFNGMNARIVSCNAVHNYYRYIDITKVEHPAWPDVVTMLSGDFYGYMMLCTHPTRNGHKWIANKVLKAI